MFAGPSGEQTSASYKAFSLMMLGFRKTSMSFRDRVSRGTQTKQRFSSFTFSFFFFLVLSKSNKNYKWKRLHKQGTLFIRSYSKSFFFYYYCTPFFFSLLLFFAFYYDVGMRFFFFFLFVFFRTTLFFSEELSAYRERQWAVLLSNRLVASFLLTLSRIRDT